MKEEIRRFSVAALDMRLLKYFALSRGAEVFIQIREK
jgi:hypothetical protein